GFPFPGGGSPFGMMFGQQQQGGGAAREDNIRVVADTTTNSILVKAKPLDMITIRSLIAKSLDSGETDSNQIIRTFMVRPGYYKKELSKEIKDAENFVYTRIETPTEAEKAEANKPGSNVVTLLHHANAIDIYYVLRDVYRESMNNNSRLGNN